MWWDEPPQEAGQIVSDGIYRSGLRRLAIVASIFLAASLLTYVIPGLSDFRPWEPGEPWPLQSVFSLDPLNEGSDAPMTAEQAKLAAAASFGEDFADNLGPEAYIHKEEEAPPAPHEGLSVDTEELKGLVLPIEDPSGHALDAFYASLAQTSAPNSTKITRISHWGDSTIAADDVTGTLRRRFQARFGDAGHGFMLIGKGRMPYRHKDVINEETGSWDVHSCIYNERKDGHYGFGGVLHRSKSDGASRFATIDKGPIGREISRFELFYHAWPAGGKLRIKLDQEDPIILDTAAEKPHDAYKVIETTDGPHSLNIKVQSGREVRLYGMAMERPGPGVVYDSLGIVGARASRILNIDEDHIAGQIAHRNTDLIVIGFGGNEAGDKGMNFERYERVMTNVIQRLRKGKPNASCLIVAPLDQGEKGRRGKIVSMPNIPKIVATQRKVAAEQGCGFFDTFAAMGGEGAMGRWYKAKPRLGWGDFRHATPAGYEVIGNMIYKALLKGYADWLE